MLRRLRSRPLARVVKLVDTGDLESPDHCDRAGSSPAPGTNNNTLKPKVPANVLSKDVGC